MASKICQSFSLSALHLLAALMLALTYAAAPPAAAQQNLTIGRSTGLPVPRFVSLDSDQDEVNVRFGPGQQYPINWIFARPGVPLEIVAEFDNWRKIKDYEGAEGWISARLLSGRRTIMIQGDIRDLKRTANSEARVLLRAEPGVIGKLMECRNDWCRVEIEGQRGWLLRGEFWGTLPGETLP
ncbi:MAG: SH3 domain-containing protein [Geminicoccaceae bacterium]